MADPDWHGAQQYTHRDATIVETVARHPALPHEIRQTYFVHPAHDLLVMQIAVAGCTKPPTLFWYENFAPRTHVVPELPMADHLFEARGDFAVFMDKSPATLYHFRPKTLGMTTWHRAETLAAQGMLAKHAASFGGGVWIGCASPDPVAAFQCGTETHENSPLIQANKGTLKNVDTATGQCGAVLSITPRLHEEVYVATVYVAFGSNRKEVDGTLTMARNAGAAALRQDNVSHWRRQLSAAHLPATDDEVILAAARRSLLTLLQAIDTKSGAIIRRAGTQQHLALDWVRDGFWTTQALDIAGLHDLAEAHTLFYPPTLRTESVPGKPCGSLPAACYGNHMEGIPHVVLEADAAAWMIGAFWRHARALDETHHVAYLKKTWRATELAAAFLVSWREVRSGMPPPSYDSRHFRDKTSPELLWSMYLGMDSAIRIAQSLKKEVPEAWQTRRFDLDTLIRMHCLDEQGKWLPAKVPPFWLEQIVENARSDADILPEDNASGCADVYRLCALALIHHANQEEAASLKRALKAVWGGSPMPGQIHGTEVTTMALGYIAAMALHGTPLPPR